MHCTQCGSPLPPGFAFCGGCGAPATHNAAQAPTVRTPHRRRVTWIFLPLFIAVGVLLTWGTLGPLLRVPHERRANIVKGEGRERVAARTEDKGAAAHAAAHSAPVEAATLAAWVTDLRRAVGLIGASKTRLVDTLGEPLSVDNWNIVGRGSGGYSYRAGSVPLMFYFENDHVSSVEVNWSNLGASVPDAGRPERADDVWHAIDPTSPGPTRLIAGGLWCQQWWKDYRGDPRQSPFPAERRLDQDLVGTIVGGREVVLECVGFEPSILTPYVFSIQRDGRVPGKSVSNPRFDWRTALVTQATVSRHVRPNADLYRNSLDTIYDIDPHSRPTGDMPRLREAEATAPDAIVPAGPNRENTEPVHRDDKVEVTARFIGPNDTYKAEVFRTADPFPIATISSFTGSEVRLHFPGVVTHARYFFRITKLSTGETRQPKGFYLKSGGPRHQFKGTTITW